MNHVDFKVFVSCITYNQEQYIKDALDGFCMQKTNFPFVCGIIDDASTDGEQSVISKYLKDYFDLDDNEVVRHEVTDDYVLTFAQNRINKNCYFAVVLLKYNHYKIKKSKLPYVAEWRDSSKFTAICEGDDYWTHPLKLQMQVDFMDNKPDYGLVHTKSKEYNESNHEYAIDLKGERNDTFDSFIMANTIVTATSFFLTQLDIDYNNDQPKEHIWPSMDLALWMYIYLHSKVGFIDEVTAVYRVLDESASHSKDIYKNIQFYNTSASICRHYIEKSGQNHLLKKWKKKYLRLITRLYYTSRKRVEWKSISPYICFDLRSCIYIIASFIMPKHG